MAIDLTGISNVNEFYTDHYLAAILENDLKDLFKQWTTAEKDEGITPPDRKIAALSREYFKALTALERVRDPKAIMEAQRPVLAGLLDALGYPFTATEQPLDGDNATLPVIAGVNKDSGAPDLWVIETLCPVAEMVDPLDQCLYSCQYQDETLATIPEHEHVDALVTKRIFSRAEPPRWLLLMHMGTAVLLDRSKWNEKRLLRFDLYEIFSRREPSTLKALAALLHRDSICPGDGMPLLDTLAENSHKHAYSVSEDLKYAVREAVELLGNEAVWYLRERRRRGVFGSSEHAEAIDPAELTHECLRYLYRLLFLFYIEARPELGYAPLQSEAYRLGYSLESLRELEMVPLTTSEAQDGFYLHESLQLLFDLVFKGFEPSKQQQSLGLSGTVHHTFDMPPLKSHLFDPGRTPTLNRCRFRNTILQRILHLLSLSSGKGQSKQQRRGRISYAQLGINQLGAVYEGLLSYSGFFVTAEGGLYEVKKAGEEYDELQNAYFVPASELQHYSDDEKFIPQPDPNQPGRTVNRLKHYPRGTFIYRLAGRNRQKSASYYTPEVLTQCVVKYALKELLKDKTADDILHLTICEPAMGSGAFLNEAITQLAVAYMQQRSRELIMENEESRMEGGSPNARLGFKGLSSDEYRQELQKVKAYIAAHNVYGVDRNPVAVELAEVSLWLNTLCHTSSHSQFSILNSPFVASATSVPWFNMQLVAGNSLIGARRQAFPSRLLTPKKGEASWLDAAPERIALGSAMENGESRIENGESRIEKQNPNSQFSIHNSQFVWHFLVPDAGMANYNDKVVKQMASTQLDAIKKWRAQFCKPFEPYHVTILERLSTKIDQLWQAHIADRRRLREEVRDEWAGEAIENGEWRMENDETGDSRFSIHNSQFSFRRRLTTQEKDKLFNERILSRIDANSSAYRRLKLVMDYWCALWFWPIDKAHMLPTREEFLLEIQSIIEGGVVEMTPIEGNQFVLNFGDTPGQQELDIYEERGYVNLNKLCRDYPRLALVQELAERYRFHHWELEFADLFAERGGFDLVLGNPPWIKVEWSEGGVLGDANPRFVFDNLSASQLDWLRGETLTKHPSLRAEYLAEFEEAEATQNFLNGYQNYPMLRGIQTNLYKCFLPQAWYIGSPRGASGFLHPEGVYDDPKGGRFREETSQRLRYHFQFQNELNLFADIDHHNKFSVNVYRNLPTIPNFDHIANLFAVQTIDACYDHPGHGLVGGIKDDDNNWNVHGHQRRIVQVGGAALTLFAQLYDESGTPALHARLSAVHADAVLSVLEKFARQPRRLGDLKGEYFSTEMWHETNTQKDGTIRRATQFPKDAGQWLLSGPHFYVGNPFNKTPRAECTKNSDYNPLDVELLPDAYLPRTNYVPACDPVSYRNRIPKVPWGGRPVTEFYRFLSREMLSQTGERTLVNAVLPKGAGHVHTCIARLLKKTSDLLDLASMSLSLVSDFHIKSTGAGHANVTVLNQLALLPEKSTYRQLLHLRTLLLTCLTTHYADLWAECWNPTFQEDGWAKADPRLDNERFRKLTLQWTRDCALRTDFERRQALVEIDVLAAMALDLTCDELCTIYRIQFPVLRQNEADTWYDQNGRIVFTCSKGLPGVGLSRAEFEKFNLRQLRLNRELRIENGESGEEFTCVKEMQSGTITRTVIDDTIEDYRFAYGRFRPLPNNSQFSILNSQFITCPCPEHPEPIPGPVERDITYVAPFTKCDREADYRTVWAEFARRKALP